MTVYSVHIDNCADEPECVFAINKIHPTSSDFDVKKLVIFFSFS